MTARKLLIPMYLSVLILAAHFLRDGNLWMVILCAMMPFLMSLRRTWARIVVQVFLVYGAFELANTGLFFRAQRLEEGRPWIRMLCIMFATALLSFVSAMLLFARSIRNLENRENVALPVNPPPQ